MDAPAVAVSRDGKRFAVAWMDERTGRNDRKVYWAVSAGGAFAREAPLADDPKGQKGHPSVAIDAKGTVHAAWEDERTGEQRIFYGSSEKGSKNAPLSPGEGKASFPSLACGRIAGAAFEWDGNVVFRAAGK
jgi:hypothetical protein